MNEHLYLPNIKLNSITLLSEHKDWLISWMEDLEKEVNDERVSSSLCLQGSIIEMIIYGKLKTDWVGIMDEYLISSEGEPFAYSEEYGKLLYGFSQWKQTTIHAVYNRWWIENLEKNKSEITKKMGNIIKQYIQPNGWIYNPKVSPTGLRTRMKSELMMSMAMGIELLNKSNLLTKYKKSFQATLSSEAFTGYMSAEFFRLKALEGINSIKFTPSGLEDIFSGCEAGKGYCDFSLSVKIDDYMGTAKRTTRDVIIHSPLSSIQALYISSIIGKKYSDILNRLKSFGAHLKSNPLDIPTFKIRDVDIPFGTDKTPLEVISASYISHLK